MKKMARISILLFLILSGIPRSSSAGLDYIGVSLGQSTSNTELTPFSTANLDDQDASFKLIIGTQITSIVAIEGFYADFGGISLTGNAGSGYSINSQQSFNFTSNGEVTSSVKALGAGALFGSNPKSTVSVYSEIGVTAWDFEISATGVSAPTISDTGIGPYIGVGLKFKLSEKFSLATDYEFHQLKKHYDVLLFSFYLNYNLN